MNHRASIMELVSPAAEAMESELATLSALLASSTQRQLTLIRELEPTGIWAAHGATSYTAWLGWRIGLTPNAARDKVRVARALGQLPAIDAAFARGRLTYSKVRALTRVADSSNEMKLLDMAQRSTASQLETICRGLRRVVRDERGAVIDAPPPERWVRERMTDDGMVRIEAQLSPDEAALVGKALELARGIGGPGAVVGAADGLLRVADAFIAGAREGQSGAERAQLVIHLRAEQLGSATKASSGTSAESLGSSLEIPSASGASLSRDASRADASLDADGDGLTAKATCPGTPFDASVGGCGGGGASVGGCGCGETRRLTMPLVAVLDDGSRIDPDAFRRIACDATLLPILVDGAGLPIDVGRRTRVVSPALRRALSVRDRGCRFPGCDHRAWVDAHHAEHWAHGGETKLANLVSLCSAHHRLVHEGGFSVAVERDGRVVFRRPDGIIVVNAPMLPEHGNLAAASTSAEVFDDTTLLPDWDGRAPDYDACVAAARSRAA